MKTIDLIKDVQRAAVLQAEHLMIANWEAIRESEQWQINFLLSHSPEGPVVTTTLLAGGKRDTIEDVVR